MKVLKELKIDSNICIFITGIENTFDANDFQSFVYIMRAASCYMPNFLKFVFTIELRDLNEDICSKVIQILAT